jgi:hypothetical protein
VEVSRLSCFFLQHSLRCFPQYFVFRHPKSEGFLASTAGIYPKFTPSVLIDYQQRFGGKLALKGQRLPTHNHFVQMTYVEHSSKMPKSVIKPKRTHKPVDFFWHTTYIFLSWQCKYHNHTQTTRRILVKLTNTMHRFTPLLYSISWLLHVSAVVWHQHGACGSVWVTLKYRSIRWYII